MLCQRCKMKIVAEVRHPGVCICSECAEVLNDMKSNYGQDEYMVPSEKNCVDVAIEKVRKKFGHLFSGKVRKPKVKKQ